MPDTLNTLTASDLRRAASLREHIEKLEKKLAVIFRSALGQGGEERPRGRVNRQVAATAPVRKRRYSKAARARMAAAAKKRWAKAKASGRKRL